MAKRLDPAMVFHALSVLLSQGSLRVYSFSDDAQGERCLDVLDAWEHLGHVRGENGTYALTVTGKRFALELAQKAVDAAPTLEAREP